MVAAVVVDGWSIDRAFGRAIFSKNHADFFGFCARGKLSFTLRSATLA
jgi:hypothetical protein